jgi:hypothetical protein
MTEAAMNNRQDQVDRRAASSPNEKKPYSRPLLTRFGDVRSLTLAPSPGMFESGYGSGFKSPGEGGQRERSRDSRDTGQ